MSSPGGGALYPFPATVCSADRQLAPSRIGHIQCQSFTRRRNKSSPCLHSKRRTKETHHRLTCTDYLIKFLLGLNISGVLVSEHSRPWVKNSRKPDNLFIYYVWPS